MTRRADVQYGEQPHIAQSLRDSSESWERAPEPSPSAPNVVLIVLDDVGFGQLGRYGSDIETPHMDRVAQEGLQFTQFHTTSLCAPTRACLMTGRNHHSVGIGNIPEWAIGFPGYNARIPRSCGFVSEVLRSAGYATFAVGKWHLTPDVDASSAGPFGTWPLARGFDRFYGFMGWETNQWRPRMYEDNHRVDAPEREEYHLTEDLVDRARAYITDLRQVYAEKPFFLHFCPGAAHTPLHVPWSYVDAYRGKFDIGWDATRSMVLQRQVENGIVPPGTSLPERIPGVESWSSSPEESRHVFARMQEVFAGFLTHTDAQIGRLLEYLEELGEADNTLVMILSDNGASGEGGPEGLINAHSWTNQLGEDFIKKRESMERIGDPTTYPHYPVGWAMAGNTPFRWMKRYVYEGGVADPLLMRWPRTIESGGTVCHQYHHAVDLAPTILEAVGVEQPNELNGIPQDSIQGVSMAYIFGNPDELTRKRVQYYECYGHRGLWMDGWKVVSDHLPGADTGEFTSDTWELYHTDEDRNEVRDLASVYPEKARLLADQWWVEAGKYNVLPLDDRYRGRASTSPNPRAGRKKFLYYPNGSDVPDPLGVNVRNRSHKITAHGAFSSSDQGVLFAQGGRFGGYVLFVEQGHLHYVYNYLGEKQMLRSSRRIPDGCTSLCLEFESTGEHTGTARLRVDQETAGVLEIAQTIPSRFDHDGAMTAGRDGSLGVSDSYVAPFPFLGELRYVEVIAEEDGNDMDA